jgi:hypothetical protein
MLTPRTDLVTIAALVAENATLVAEIGALRASARLFLAAMRALPARADYSPVVQVLWWGANGTDADRVRLLAAVQALRDETETEPHA